MKRLTVGLLLALMLLPVVAWSLDTDFEDGFQANGVGKNFVAYTITSPDPVYSDETAIKYEGSHAQKIDTSAGGEGGVYYQFKTIEGVSYRVGVWVNTDGNASAQIGVDLTGDTDPAASTIQWVASSQTGVWHEINFIVTATGDWTTLYCNARACVAYFDNVKMKEITPPTFGPNPHLIWNERVYWQRELPESGNPMGHSQTLLDGDKAVIAEGDGGILIYGDESINGSAYLGGTPRWGSMTDPPSTAFYPTKGVTIHGDYLISQDGNSRMWYCTPWEGPWLSDFDMGRLDSECYGLYSWGGFIYGSDNIEMTDPNNARSVIHKFSFDPVAGTFTKIEDGIWPVTLPEPHSAISAIGGYNGKIYAAEAYQGRNIFEIDCETGAVQKILYGNNLIPLSVGDGNDFHMGQVARCGDTIVLGGWSGYLTVWKLVDGVWTLFSNNRSAAPLPTGGPNFLGLSLKPGPDGNAKYVWASVQNLVNFWDLDPDFTIRGLGEVRKMKNGYPTGLGNVVVTKVGAGEFWAEDKDRASAVRVAWGGTMPGVDAVLSMTGSINTAESGEKVFNALTVTPSGATHSIKPVYVTNKNLGPAEGSAGLANDGMLVTICGRANFFDPNTMALYVDDGSGVPSDIPGITGVKVTTADITSLPDFFQMISYPPPYPYLVTVTGIVRLEKAADGTIVRKIETRTDSDIILTALEM